MSVHAVTEVTAAASHCFDAVMYKSRLHALGIPWQHMGIPWQQWGPHGNSGCLPCFRVDHVTGPDWLRTPKGVAAGQPPPREARGGGCWMSLGQVKQSSEPGSAYSGRMTKPSTRQAAVFASSHILILSICTRKKYIFFVPSMPCLLCHTLFQKKDVHCK